MTQELRKLAERLSPDRATVLRIDAEQAGEAITELLDRLEKAEKDAVRYRKLQLWMASNVKEGWEIVEQLGAVAAWQGIDEMTIFLDSLDECNVGLCEKAAMEASK